MVGPMSLHPATGRFQAVMGEDGPFSGECCGWAFFCCPCLLVGAAVALVGGLAAAINRCCIGMIKGVLTSPLVGLTVGMYALAVSLLLTPLVAVRSVQAVRDGHACAGIISLCFLPVRPIDLLLLCMVGGILYTLSWTVLYTLFVPKPCQVHLLLFGGLSELLRATRAMCSEATRYHAAWSIPGSMWLDEVFLNAGLSFSNPAMQESDAAPATVGRSTDVEAAPPCAVPDREMDKLKYIAGQFFRQCTRQGRALLDAGIITEQDVADQEPFLFVGLPSLVFLQLLRRSEQADGGFLFESGEELSEQNRPQSGFAVALWAMALKAQTKFKDAAPFSDEDANFLDAATLACPRAKDSGEIGPFMESGSSMTSARRAQLNGVAAACTSIGIAATKLPVFKRHFGNVFSQLEGGGGIRAGP